MQLVSLISRNSLQTECF